MNEEHKEGYCPNCGVLVVDRVRTIKKENGSIKREPTRLSGLMAQIYLDTIAEKSERKRIFNEHIQKGSKSGSHWYHGKGNKYYDHNDKSHGEVVKWEELKELAVAV